MHQPLPGLGGFSFAPEIRCAFRILSALGEGPYFWLRARDRMSEDDAETDDLGILKRQLQALLARQESGGKADAQVAATPDPLLQLFSKLAQEAERRGHEQRLLQRRLDALSGRLEVFDGDWLRFVQFSGDPVVLFNAEDRKVVDANRPASELFARTPQQLRSARVEELFVEEEGEALLNMIEEARDRRQAWAASVMLQDHTGRTVLGDVQLCALERAERPCIAMLVRDVTQEEALSEAPPQSYAALSEAQTRLASSEEKYRKLVEAAGDAVLILSFESGSFIEANDAACELFGYERDEFRKLTPDALVPDAQARRKAGVFEPARGWQPNARLKRKDGALFWAEVRSCNYRALGETHYIAVIRDVTWRVEREQELADSYRMLEETQAKLVQASKLSAMGELGAGIAHELNQPITIIQGFAQRIRRHSNSNISEHLDELGIIVDETVRMARIVDNIRTFARQSDFNPQPSDPLVPVQNAIMLLNAQMNVRGIRIVEDFGEALPQINADLPRLQQVFLNLLVNARDALHDLPAQAKREIRFVVQSDGNRVVYRVEDSGLGVPPELESRIFEPFYTSKPLGQGTGLGLSIAYGIVKDHGGEIHYEAGERSGARFVVSLPGLSAQTEVA